MKFDVVKDFKEEEFRRLTGVKLQTFSHMVQILEKALKQKEDAQVSLRLKICF